ncbi:MAG: PKD domain-containing protein, partial [Clostridiales bacterium]|nr:PKD domain-containing protein [Clostridiales bacterium]
YYKVSVTDFAGNESPLTEAFSAPMAEDTESPRVVGFYPTKGAYIGQGSRNVSIYAADNRRLGEIAVEYKKNGGAYNVLRVFDAIGSREQTVSVEIPLESFDHDDIISFRITATDTSGNVGESNELYYIVDKRAPAVVSPAAVYESVEGHVTVSWTSDLADDLSGYRIYRKTADGDYGLVGSVAVKAEQSGQPEYRFDDRSISLTRETYTYRVDAVDVPGNVSGAYTSPVTTEKRGLPVAVISCDPVMEAGVQYEIDAAQSTGSVGIVSYLFDFGDGTTSAESRAVHRYAETGVYTIRLTVTDADGDTGVVTKDVYVRERAAIGQAEIRVSDENGNPVQNAFVYFDLGTENQTVKSTNSGGYATFDAAAGKYPVGAFIPDNNWLPTAKEIVVAAGETARITLTLVHQTLIEGSFEVKRLSFEEITAAGIDVTKPENQHIAKFLVTLTFGVETIDISFNYNGMTKEFVGNPDGGADVRTVVKDGRELSIDVQTDSEFSYVTVAVLEIPVNATFLKEFFDVSLTLINNSASEFSMLDNRITLNVPEGMSIAESNISENDRVVLVPEIPGQTQKRITWILRGDKPGEYPISADYIGRLGVFDEQITATFASKSPIKVYGEEGVELIFEYEDTIDDGFIYFNVGFHNFRESAADAHVDLLSLEVPGAEPYAYKRSAAGSDEYNDDDPKWGGKGGGWNFDNLQDLYDSLWGLADGAGDDAGSGLEAESPSRWELEKWRLREDLPAPGENTVVYPGEIYWQYYKAPIEVFATYINPDLPWDSDTEAIGSTLVEFMSELLESSSVSIPMKIKAIGTKRTYFAGDGPVSIVFSGSGDRRATDKEMWPSSYSDAFFRNPNTKYNHSLAKMSLGLALAGFSSRDESAYTPPANVRRNHGGGQNADAESPVFSEQGMAKDDAAKRARNLTRAYNDMEFGCMELHNYGRDLGQTGPIPNEAAYAFAHKQIVLEGAETTVVSVVVRGGNYGSEWGGNFNLGDPEAPGGAASLQGHFGYEKAAADVVGKLNDYLAEHGISGAKYWATGYGRGGAIANIVSKQLTDAGKDVYAYLFAAPQSALLVANAENDQNIFNVISPADFFTYVPFGGPNGEEGWNYQRYGRDMPLPSIFSDSSYLEMYEEVREKLEDFPGDDPYHEIGLVYLLDALLELYPSPADYASVQNELANFAASSHGGYAGSLADFAAELLRKAGAGDLLDPPANPEDEWSRAALAASYAATGMDINHMPEYYIVWMTSYLSWEMFKAQESYKLVSVAFAPAEAPPTPAELVHLNITVKSSSGDVALQITDGQIVRTTPDGAVAQKIAAMYENGLAHLYLPGDDDFVVEFIPSVGVTVDYSVYEYVNRRLTGTSAQENVQVQAGLFAIGNVPGASSTDEAEYQLYIDFGLPPDAPADFGVSPTSGSIELSWSYAPTAIFSHFAVFRSVLPDVDFVEIAQVSANGFSDDSSTGLELATPYYYYVVSVDDRGRASDPTPILSAQIPEDTEPPVILDYSPKDGEEFSLIGELVMSVKDNFKLAGGTFEYRKQGDEEWTLITEFAMDAIRDEYAYFWNVIGFASGAYELRFMATDAAGNQSEIATSLITIKEYVGSGGGGGGGGGGGSGTDPDTGENGANGGYGPNGKAISPIDPPATDSIPIATAAQLLGMSLGGKYHLVQDIDMTTVNWVPMGNYGSPFTGELDGQGFAIRNLKID